MTMSRFRAGGGRRSGCVCPVLLLLSLFVFPACENPQHPLVLNDATSRILLFGEQAAGVIEEKWVPAGPMMRVLRVSKSALSPGVVTHLDVWLFDDGSVFHAEWTRNDGRRKVRVVSGTMEGETLRVQTSEGFVRRILVAGAWVLPETLHLWQPGPKNLATLVELPGGERLSLRMKPERAFNRFLDDSLGEFARVFPSGTRVGPGAFVEHETPEGATQHRISAMQKVHFQSSDLEGRWWLDGVDAAWGNLALKGPAQRFFVREGRVGTHHEPVLRDVTPPVFSDYQPSLGIESEHLAIHRFATVEFVGDENNADARADAWRLAKRIHERMFFSARGGPPSALATLASLEGDCDNASALLVAALRARGHAARAVVGYRVWDGALSPHAWAEVYTGEEWLSIDPSVPAMGPLMSHLRMFEGLGSSLSMGRVLGRLTVEALPTN